MSNQIGYTRVWSKDSAAALLFDSVPADPSQPLLMEDEDVCDQLEAIITKDGISEESAAQLIRDAMQYVRSAKTTLANFTSLEGIV